MSNIYDKRKCPFCGGIIDVVERDIHVQTRNSYNFQNESQETHCRFKCENCTAEFDANFHFLGGHAIPSSKSANITCDIPSVGIMGTTEGRRRIW